MSRRRHRKASSMNKEGDRVRRPELKVDGLLLVDKPSGLSSFDVIRHLRRQTGVRKMGHTGTLDPMATGLLVICLGEATKLVPYLTADDKTYEAEITFGTSTNTYDAEGEVIGRTPPEYLSSIDEDMVSQQLSQFMGEQDQRPPSFSAIKVNGKRLYQLARRGEDVQAPMRRVHFYTLNILGFEPYVEEANEYPRVRITVACSKGTYIRSLAHDLGEALGCCAHLSALRRTQAGAHTLHAAHELNQIDAEHLSEQLLPIVGALPNAPIVKLSSKQVISVRQGKAIPPPPSISPSNIYRAISPEGELVALLKEDHGSLRVQRGINATGSVNPS